MTLTCTFWMITVLRAIAFTKFILLSVGNLNSFNIVDSQISVNAWNPHTIVDIKSETYSKVSRKKKFKMMPISGMIVVLSRGGN